MMLETPNMHCQMAWTKGCSDLRYHCTVTAPISSWQLVGFKNGFYVDYLQHVLDNKQGPKTDSKNPSKARQTKTGGMLSEKVRPQMICTISQLLAYCTTQAEIRHIRTTRPGWIRQGVCPVEVVERIGLPGPISTSLRI